MQLDGFIKDFAPHLDPALVSIETLDTLRRDIGALPVLTRGGFECRLAEEAATADFLVAMTTDDVARFFGAVEDWPTLQTFAEQWRTDPLYAPITHLWYEFDLGDTHPSIFFYNLEHTPDRAAITTASLKTIFGPDIATALQPHLDRYFNALPADLPLFGVGAPIARGITAVRMNTHHLSIGTIIPLLEKIGWPVDDDLRGLLDKLSDMVTYINLSVDFLEQGLFPRLGLDLHMERNKRPRFSPEWVRLLDWLVAENLALPEKRTAAEKWCGHHYQEVVSPGVTLRALSHVKLAYQPGGYIEAKLYLGFFHAQLTSTFQFRRFK